MSGHDTSQELSSSMTQPATPCKRQSTGRGQHQMPGARTMRCGFMRDCFIRTACQSEHWHGRWTSAPDPAQLTGKSPLVVCWRPRRRRPAGLG